MIEIKNIYGEVIYVAPNAETVKSAVEDAVKNRASLVGKKILSLRVISYSAYRWQIQAVLFQDGSRWVRMGCLFKSLEDWEKCGGIRKSNLLAYPDDGSERSEERAAAFEFAKAAVLRMKLSENEAHHEQ